MSKYLSRLNKILSARICSTPFAAFIGLVFIGFTLALFTGPGFVGWLMERVRDWIHLWF